MDALTPILDRDPCDLARDRPIRAPGARNAPRLSAHPGWVRARAQALEVLRVGNRAALVGEPGTGKSLLLRDVAGTLRGTGWRVIAPYHADVLDMAPPDAGSIVVVDEADRLGATELACLFRRGGAILLAGVDLAERPLPSDVVLLRLKSLSPAEIGPFLSARAAPDVRAPTFADEALARLGALSGGVPRLVATLADGAAWLADLDGASRVRAEHVEEAASLRGGLPVPEPLREATALARPPDGSPPTVTVTTPTAGTGVALPAAASLAVAPSGVAPATGRRRARLTVVLAAASVLPVGWLLHASLPGGAPSPPVAASASAPLPDASAPSAPQRAVLVAEEATVPPEERAADTVAGNVGPEVSAQVAVVPDSRRDEAPARPSADDSSTGTPNFVAEARPEHALPGRGAAPDPAPFSGEGSVAPTGGEDATAPVAPPAREEPASGRVIAEATIQEAAPVPGLPEASTVPGIGEGTSAAVSPPGSARTEDAPSGAERASAPPDVGSPLVAAPSVAMPPPPGDAAEPPAAGLPSGDAPTLEPRVGPLPHDAATAPAPEWAPPSSSPRTVPRPSDGDRAFAAVVAPRIAPDLPPAAPQRAVRRAPPDAGPVAGPVAARRCRNVAFRYSIGEDLSYADLAFLRDGCPAR